MFDERDRGERKKKMSEKIFEVEGVIRTVSGKGSARRLRRAGGMPAVIYSGGQESVSLDVSPKEMSRILRTDVRRNAVINLTLKDQKGADQGVRSVMVQALQKHPVRRNLTHVDFVEIDLKKPLFVDIPIELLGRSKQVTAGGRLDQVQRKVKVKCLPEDIPVSLPIDITDLAFGTTSASALSPPENIELLGDPSAPIITIRTPRGEDEVAEEGEAEAVEGEESTETPAADSAESS